jgi:hypothetical protein
VTRVRLASDFNGFAVELALVSLGLGLVVEISLAAVGVAGIAHVCRPTCFAIGFLELVEALSTLHARLIIPPATPD